MKLIVKQSDIVKKLELLNFVATNRSIIPILDYGVLDVMDDKFSLYSTNLQVNVNVMVECDVETKGKCLVPLKKTLSILRTFKGKDDIIFESHKDGWLEIKSGKSKFKLPFPSINDYPEIKNVTDVFNSNVSIVKKADLVDVLNKTFFAVDITEGRYALDSICFDDFVTATNGRILSREKNNVFKHSEKFLINRNGIQVIKKILQIVSKDEFLYFLDSENFYISDGESVYLSILLSDGNFPNVDTVLSKGDFVKFDLRRIDLIDSITRISKIGNDVSDGLKFKFGTEKLILEMGDPDAGIATDEIAVNNSKDIYFILNVRYILDILKSFKKDEIELLYFDDNNIVKMREKDADGFRLIMTMMTK